MYWLWFEAWEHLLLTAWGWSKESLAQERVMMVLHCTARILHASWEPRLGIRILSLSRDAPGWAIGLGHRGTSRHWLWEIWAHMWSVSASRCLNLRSLGALAAAISYPWSLQIWRIRMDIHCFQRSEIYGILPFEWCDVLAEDFQIAIPKVIHSVQTHCVLISQVLSRRVLSMLHLG